MNPRVGLHIDTDNIRQKPPEFFANFDVVIATELDIDTYSLINASCRISNRPFYASGLHGFYGYVFADLISHDFVIEREKSNIPSQVNETPTRSIVNITTKKENEKNIEMVTKREVYSPIILANTSPLPEEYTRIPRKRKQVTLLLTCLRALFEFQKLSAGRLPNFSREDIELFTSLAHERHLELKLELQYLTADFIRAFIQNLGCELSPVAAFLGGSLAQDVINVLSAREQPLQNLLLFDGEKNVAPVYPMHPIFPPMSGDVGREGDTAGNGNQPAVTIPGSGNMAPAGVNAPTTR